MANALPDNSLIFEAPGFALIANGRWALVAAVVIVAIITIGTRTKWRKAANTIRRWTLEFGKRFRRSMQRG